MDGRRFFNWVHLLKFATMMGMGKVMQSTCWTKNLAGKNSGNTILKLLYTNKKAIDNKVGFCVCLSVGVIWILPPNCKDRKILCIVLPRRWRKGNQQVFLPQLSVRCPHTLSKQHFSKPSDDFTCAGHGDDRPVEGLGAEVDNNIIQGWQTRLWVFC